jgi:DinB superfamily
MEFDLPRSIAVLSRTPATLSSLLLGLDDAWVRAAEGPGTWSPYDVVGHLLHGEHADWIPRARIILAAGAHRRFDPYDRTAHFTESTGRTMDTLLMDFASARAANLATLAGWQLTQQQLDLQGEHPAFGAVTLRQLLATWVAHDLGHLVQVSRVMAHQYREAVGPWRAYLSVLADRAPAQG